jgi:hypothetical protein
LPPPLALRQAEDERTLFPFVVSLSNHERAEDGRDFHRAKLFGNLFQEESSAGEGQLGGASRGFMNPLD